jgi:hypothetical protein
MAACVCDNALQLAYQAQLQAATAMLHARGLRVRSRNKHHYVAIATARELAATEGDADLARAMVTLDGLRTDRAIAVYEPEPASPAIAAHARSAMAVLLPNALTWLQRAVPAVAPSLHPIPAKVKFPGELHSGLEALARAAAAGLTANQCRRR